MTRERLEQLRAKLRNVAVEVEAARDAFFEENPASDTARQLILSTEYLDSVDEMLQDAIRYHPQGDCPR